MDLQHPEMLAKLELANNHISAKEYNSLPSMFGVKDMEQQIPLKRKINMF